MPPSRPARYGLSLRALAEVRHTEPRDAAGIAAFLNAHARRYGGEADTSLREVEHWLSLDTWVTWVAEAEGEVVAYADANERPGKKRYWLFLRALEPAGAAALLQTVERWAGERAAPGALLHVSTSSDDGPTCGVLEARGYRVVRYELEMRVDLDEEPPEPVWPEGMSVRTLRPGADDEEAWRAYVDAFADHWEFIPDPFEDWCKEVFGHPEFDRGLFFLPVEGDAVAGLAFCLVRDLGKPVGWVDILGVRPAWRRRGLGLALLHHSFRELRGKGAAWAGLEVDAENLTGAVRLYERAGMSRVKQMSLYEREVGR